MAERPPLWAVVAIVAVTLGAVALMQSGSSTAPDVQVGDAEPDSPSSPLPSLSLAPAPAPPTCNVADVDDDDVCLVAPAVP